jgi:hypothetical protein
MARSKWLLSVLVSICVVPLVASWSQSSGTESPGFLLRLERQTRDEDVCILVRRDGQFHLERIALGFDRSRVFEGTFPSADVSELEQMLNTDKLKDLTQSQITAALIGEELDHVLLAIRRPTGWQSLNFPTGGSRKPFRDSLDPLVKWLERTKQQPHPLPNVVPSRCMPPQEPAAPTSITNVATATQESAPSSANKSQANSYLVRIVVDHYLPADLNFSSKVERTCVIVYYTRRYRMERSKQEFNSAMRTEVFRDSLSESQMQELHQLLDAPALVNLKQRTAATTTTIREGDVANLAIPRGRDTQVLSFASFFGARTQEKGMRDNTRVSVDEDVQVIKPVRKWIRTNIEDRRVPAAKDLPATTCIPSTQPE